ncbi:unnamed protein product, partial [Iphiclides podalirius]
MLCLAMDVTWPSPVLVMLKNETMTPLSHVVTDEESSWIVSVYFLSALFRERLTIKGYLPQLSALARAIIKIPYFLHSKGRSEDALAVLKFLRDSESTALTELNGYNVDKGINFDKRAFFREKTFIKTTLIGTVIALGTQLLGLGVFFTALKELKAESIHGFFNYLPLLSMGIVVLCFSSGAGPLYLLLIVELLDSPYRMVGTNVCMFASVMASFLLTKYFAAIITAIGSAATFYACSCNCLAFCVFVVIFVPETKNKSFGEIQSALANRVCHLKCSIKSTKM